MRWHFSRASVEECSALHYLATKLCVQWREIDTADLFLSGDKTKDISSLSRFGMMCVPLMEDLGEAVLDSFLAGFPVRISQAQTQLREKVSLESSQGSGWRWPGSSLKYYPEESLWRTRHACLFPGWGLDRFSGTWPSSGIMLHGECWELIRLEPLTREIESGSSVLEWRTPTASDAKNNAPPSQLKKIEQGGRNAPHVMLNAQAGGPLNPPWVAWLMGFPIGWTDSEPLETLRFLSWRLTLSASLNLDFSEGESDDD